MPWFFLKIHQFKEGLILTKQSIKKFETEWFNGVKMWDVLVQEIAMSFLKNPFMDLGGKNLAKMLELLCFLLHLNRHIRSFSAKLLPIFTKKNVWSGCTVGTLPDFSHLRAKVILIDNEPCDIGSTCLTNTGELPNDTSSMKKPVYNRYGGKFIGSKPSCYTKNICRWIFQRVDEYKILWLTLVECWFLLLKYLYSWGS